MNESEAAVEQVVVAAKAAAKPNEMSLSEGGRSDAAKGLRDKLTGWGAICKERASKHQSKRGERRRARKG